MHLILARHGETVENREGIIQGQMQNSLSELGIEQGEKLALRLKHEKIDYIYSSDLVRASNTAKAIAKYHPNTPVLTDKNLRERDVGPYTGKKVNIVWTDLPPGVEDNQSMMKRIKKFLDSVYEHHPNSTVLVVGHEGINKTIECAICGKPATEMKGIPDAPNASVLVFEL